MKKLNAPATMQWELTSVCNHDCIHCYNYWRNDPEPLKHPDVDYMAVAREISKANPVHVVLTGGEPLSVFYKTIDAVRFLHDNGAFVSWNTNAALATEDIAKKIKDVDGSVFVSLPCADPDICDTIVNKKDSLKNIERGIKTFVAAGVQISVNMVVSKYNEDYIFETAKYAKGLGVRGFCIAPASRPFGADEAFDAMAPDKDIIDKICCAAEKIEEELGMKVTLTGALPGCAFSREKDFQKFAYVKTCTAGKVSCGIDAEGNVKACARDSKIYGNLFEEDIFSIWNKMEEWRDNSLLPEECKTCKDVSICKGGCRLEACSTTGKRNQMDTFARKENLPIAYTKIGPKYFFIPNTMFKTKKSIRFNNEPFGVRASVGPRFVYITEATREWLEKHSYFTLEDMVDAFGKDAEPALKQTILILLNTGMISVFKA